MQGIPRSRGHPSDNSGSITTDSYASKGHVRVHIYSPLLLSRKQDTCIFAIYMYMYLLCTPI